MNPVGRDVDDFKSVPFPFECLANGGNVAKPEDDETGDRVIVARREVSVDDMIAECIGRKHSINQP